MNYGEMKLVDLKELAKKKGLKSVTALKKDELIKRLLEFDKSNEKKPAPKKAPKETPKKEIKKERVVKDKAVKDKTLVRVSKPDETEIKKPVEAKQKTMETASQGFEKAERKPAETVIKKPLEAPIKKPSEAPAKKPEDAQKRFQRPGQDQPQNNDQNKRPQRYVNISDMTPDEIKELDSGELANGILEIMPDGFGFIRSANYLPGDNDIYVSPMQIRKFGLRSGDIVKGSIRKRTQGEKFGALLQLIAVNDCPIEEFTKRPAFEDMTPIFPNERINLENEYSKGKRPMRIMNLMAPIGKGQRGMIVSPPKAGKTTLLKQVAISVSRFYPDMHLIVLLIDERPEEVTDIRESIEGPNVEVIYSTFDELPDHHKRVSEMVLERAKRLVEQKKDVMILLDSITRLARAYNLTVPPSGRTLTGGLDPAALYMPKKFFGAARNMREGGSLTILATALVDTGSKMDDVVYEEFKGTGNMELVLDRKMSERRIFPAMDIIKSGTRRDDLLLTPDEKECVDAMHRELAGNKPDETTAEILKLFERTQDNREFIEMIKKSLLRK